jgi:hypothetical protein
VGKLSQLRDDSALSVEALKLIAEAIFLCNFSIYIDFCVYRFVNGTWKVVSFPIQIKFIYDCATTRIY